MQKANVGIDPLHHLAVKLEHEPQYAVCRRMLRTKVHGEIAQLRFRDWLSHHALSVPAFAAFARRRSLNLSHATTNR
jgi:hypothetical protein